DSLQRSRMHCDIAATHGLRQPLLVPHVADEEPQPVAVKVQRRAAQLVPDLHLCLTALASRIHDDPASSVPETAAHERMAKRASCARNEDVLSCEWRFGHAAI